MAIKIWLLTKAINALSRNAIINLNVFLRSRCVFPILLSYITLCAFVKPEIFLKVSRSDTFKNISGFKATDIESNSGLFIHFTINSCRGGRCLSEVLENPKFK
jgi:hypothetical protein